MTKTFPWDAAHAAPPLSATLLHLVAGVLRTGSELLARVAERLATAHAEKAAAMPETVEFSSIQLDGASFGALYVDGKLVALIPGVTRL